MSFLAGQFHFQSLCNILFNHDGIIAARDLMKPQTVILLRTFQFNSFIKYVAIFDDTIYILMCINMCYNTWQLALS